MALYTTFQLILFYLWFIILLVDAAPHPSADASVTSRNKAQQPLPYLDLTPKPAIPTAAGTFTTPTQNPIPTIAPHQHTTTILTSSLNFYARRTHSTSRRPFNYRWIFDQTKTSTQSTDYHPTPPWSYYRPTSTRSISYYQPSTRSISYHQTSTRSYYRPQTSTTGYGDGGLTDGQEIGIDAGKEVGTKAGEQFAEKFGISTAARIGAYIGGAVGLILSIVGGVLCCRYCRRKR
jgi:hypothetical protein